jgi:hypothetical protein
MHHCACVRLQWDICDVQGTGLTAEQMTDMIWQAQDDFKPCIAEAEQQQKRALERHVTDVLMVLSGLGCVHKGVDPHGCATDTAYVPMHRDSLSLLSSFVSLM